MTKETIGKISTDLLIKQKDDTHTAEDQMRESLSDWDKNIEECIDRCKKTYMFDFYLVVTTKKERLMPNVLRNYFMGRHTCPTPEYDQTVYKYHRRQDYLEFLWVVPSKHTCLLMTRNALTIDKSEHELLNFVLMFNDGTLLRKSKLLNGEVKNSPIIEK